MSTRVFKLHTGELCVVGDTGHALCQTDVPQGGTVDKVIESYEQMIRNLRAAEKRVVRRG